MSSCSSTRNRGGWLDLALHRLLANSCIQGITLNGNIFHYCTPGVIPPFATWDSDPESTWFTVWIAHNPLWTVSCIIVVSAGPDNRGPSVASSILWVCPRSPFEVLGISVSVLGVIVWEIQLPPSQPFYEFKPYLLGITSRSAFCILAVRMQTRILSDHWSSICQRSDNSLRLSSLNIHRSPIVCPQKAYIRCSIELDGTVVSIIPLNGMVGIPSPVFPAIEAQAQEQWNMNGYSPSNPSSPITIQ